MSYASIPSVGSKIRVTTKHRNVYHVNSETTPYVLSTYEGTVLPENSGGRIPPNSFYMTGTDTFPVRCICLEFVTDIAVVSGSLSKLTTSAQVRAFCVKSDKQKYIVTVAANKYTCTCTGFQYRKNCRHIKAVENKVRSVK